MKHQPHQPPFDAFPPDHASYIAGDSLDMEDFDPIAIEQEPPVGWGHGCLVLIAGAVLGLGLGWGAACVGAFVAGHFVDVPVPWPW